MSNESTTRDRVIVLHGIARSHWSMSQVSKALRRAGFEVLNLGYPSTRLPLEGLLDHICPQVEKFNQDPRVKLHFVGYSMGGLLARGVIHRHQPENLGRVVQLSPPNGGSEVADFWKNFFLFRWVFGPAGQDLGRSEQKFSRILGPVDFDLGVIAGNRTWDPFSSALIEGPNDGKVSVASTRVEGMKDHIVIPATHTFIIYNKEAFRQVIHFLRHGEFIRGGA